MDIDPNYKNPTETLPLCPPSLCQVKHTKDQSDIRPCVDCNNTADWWSQFENTTDDLLYKSNIHTCRQSNPRKLKPKKEAITDTKSIPSEGSAQTPETKAARNGPKGCLNKSGVCMARFPRELYPETIIDKDDGHISMKKHEIYDEYIYPCSYIFVAMQYGCF